MSKQKIIKNLKDKHPKLNESELNKIYEIFCNSIQSALVDKKNVEIRGFGTFFVKEIKEKFSARNPKTGDSVSLPGKNAAHFKPGKVLRNRINNSHDKT